MPTGHYKRVKGKHGRPKKKQAYRSNLNGQLITPRDFSAPSTAYKLTPQGNQTPYLSDERPDIMET